jgi:protein-S-isoprenylcysteine O-methyltransferase Ste14
MKRADAALGSAAFFLLAPGIVAGLLPSLITHWRAGDDASTQNAIIGWVLIALSLAALIECFIRFVRHDGTPAPVAPTQRLVVTGLYRFVRNPMYLAVLGLIFGQMFLFANAALLAYGVTVWLAFVIFVSAYEEPTLRRDFPEDYAAYSLAVPPWLPRLTPWRGPEGETPDS